LCFNLEMTIGRESYEENIKIFRDFIRYHRPPVLTKTVINDMVFLRRP
jgi:hypothetical protein